MKKELLEHSRSREYRQSEETENKKRRGGYAYICMYIYIYICMYVCVFIIILNYIENGKLETVKKREEKESSEREREREKKTKRVNGWDHCGLGVFTLAQFPVRPVYFSQPAAGLGPNQTTVKNK